jgi:hypothetical protein
MEELTNAGSPGISDIEVFESVLEFAVMALLKLEE